MTRTALLAPLLLALSVAACAPAADDVATADEASMLPTLREEEKLAHDVYVALEAQAPQFTNIAASEQTHTDAVRTLLDRYDIADPAAGRAAGSFASPVFTSLYTQLVTAGRVSSVEALRVGVEIEELDLHDIAEMQSKAGHSDVANTLANLARGSRNHLRAFWSQFAAAGGSYTPRHLDEATFRAIIGSPQETGRAL